MCKVYVEIVARFTREGQLVPQSITWEDGRKYDIDRVRDIRRMASLKAGGVGIRYTCQICGQDKYLFYEGNNMWFVEGLNEEQ